MGDTVGKVRDKKKKKKRRGKKRSYTWISLDCEFRSVTNDIRQISIVVGKGSIITSCIDINIEYGNKPASCKGKKALHMEYNPSTVKYNLNCNKCVKSVLTGFLKYAIEDRNKCNVIGFSVNGDLKKIRNYINLDLFTGIGTRDLSRVEFYGTGSLRVKCNREHIEKTVINSVCRKLIRNYGTKNYHDSLFDAVATALLYSKHKRYGTVSVDLPKTKNNLTHNTCKVIHLQKYETGGEIVSNIERLYKTS